MPCKTRTKQGWYRLKKNVHFCPCLTVVLYPVYLYISFSYYYTCKNVINTNKHIVYLF